MPNPLSVNKAYPLTPWQSDYQDMLGRLSTRKLVDEVILVTGWADLPYRDWYLSTGLKALDERFDNAEDTEDVVADVLKFLRTTHVRLDDTQVDNLLENLAAVHA